MAPDNLSIGSGPNLSPEEVAHRGFSSAFRGFDPAEVRAFLEKVSAEMRSLRDRYYEAERQRKDAENRAAHPVLDESTLASALGEETSRILRSAQEAAADIKAKAGENVEKILADAHAEAGRLRTESEGILSKRTAEADRAASSIREAAESWAEQVRARAAEEAEQTLAAARDEGRGMVEEAQSLRAKVLGDLARRRKVGHVQVEQLRAGRERLLDAYRVVRRTLDEVTEELQRAETEARVVAETAAARMSSEPETTMEEMEAAIVSARDVEPSAPTPVKADETKPDVETKPEEAGSTPVLPAPDKVVPIKPTITSVVTTPSASEGPPVIGAGRADGAEQGDERRLSSLRILRRGKPDDGRTPSVKPIGRASTEEGVRVIRPAGDLAPSEPEAKPAIDADYVGDVEESSDESADVEELFARLRAGRESAADEAREVLERAESDDPVKSEDPAPGEAESQGAESPGAETETEPEQGSDESDEPSLPDGDEGLLQARDNALQGVDRQLARRVKRALQDDQNDLLDRLRQRGRSKAESVLGDEDEHVRRFADAAREHLAEAAKVGSESAGGADGTADVDDLAVDLASALTSALRVKLASALAAVESEGDDEPAAADRVGVAYREWKSARIERLVGDHTVGAFTRGVLAAGDDTVSYRWVVSDLDGPCPDCDDNALAGPTTSGAAYPTGQHHPPAHAGCRCLLTPLPH